MRVSVILAAVFTGLVSAQGICFDDFDCLLSGGGKCTKAPGQFLLGSCSKSGSATTTLKTTASSGGTAPAATGSVCFDAGDCILSGGGKCVKAPGQLILGNCVKN